MPKKKQQHMMNAIEPRNDELIDMIKKYIFLDFNDEAMINAILTKTGNLISRNELNKWKEVARRDKKEAKVEIDIYLKNMMELGIFEDVMRQYETSKEMLSTNTMTYFKVVRDGDVNKQIALTTVITKQMENMMKLTTSIGWLTKSKEVLERGFASGNDNTSGTSITIQTKPGSNSFDEAVNDSIGEIELKDNEVF